MALFCAAIRRDSVSLLKFIFHSHVQVFLCKITPVVAWNTQTFFSSHFCFLVMVVLLVLIILSVLLLAAVSNLSLFFLMQSLSLRIYAFSAGYSSSSSYRLSISYLGCKAVCIVINFLVLWSIYLSSSLVHFKNGPEVYSFDEIICGIWWCGD